MWMKTIRRAQIAINPERLMNLKRKRLAMVLVAALLVLFSGVRLCTAEATVSLFPVLYWDESDETTRVDVAAPFVTLQSSPTRWLLALHPLFSAEKDFTKETMSYDVLYPILRFRGRTSEVASRSRGYFDLLFLIHWRSQRDGMRDKSLTILPLIYWGNQGEGRKYVLILPLFLYANEAKIYVPYYALKRQSFFSIFPLYGTFRNLPRRDRLQFLLWPLFVFSSKDETKVYNFVYPFFHYITGGDRMGFKVWPLIGYFRDSGRALKIYYLWPLGHHYRTKLDTADPETLEMFLPFFARVRKKDFAFDYIFPLYAQRRFSGETSRAFLWPLLTVWRNVEKNYHGFSLLWRIFWYERGEDRMTTELFPIAGKTISPNRYRSYFLWFVYNHLISEDADTRFERRYLFPLYIYKQEIWKKTGNEEIRRIFLPFFSFAKEKDGTREKSSLWPLWYDHSEGYERNWAPLWRLYESINYANGDFEKQYGWGFYRSSSKGGVRKSEVNALIFHYRSRDDERQLNFLGGLFGLRKSREGTRLTLLYSLL
jgi:hypothetical protein